MHSRSPTERTSTCFTTCRRTLPRASSTSSQWQIHTYTPGSVLAFFSTHEFIHCYTYVLCCCKFFFVGLMSRCVVLTTLWRRRTRPLATIAVILEPPRLVRSSLPIMAFLGFFYRSKTFRYFRTQAELFNLSQLTLNHSQISEDEKFYAVHRVAEA